MSNKIVSKTYYEIDIILSSPANIGNGVSNETDADVIRSSRGECFIPGTSLAGAFRNFIGAGKDKQCAFGYSDRENGEMSSIFISDLYFEDGTVKTSVRDRVDLTEDKGVNNKFDIEVIEPGAKGTIYIETVTREKTLSRNIDPNKDIDDIILAIQEGDIRIGSVKNRGFGRTEVVSVRVSSFDRSTRDEWVSFMSGDMSAAGDKVLFSEWKLNKKSKKKRYVKFTVPLTLTGGISIRKYSAQPGRADFEHITSNGKPIIPGTSWNGAIRADARRILVDIGKSAKLEEGKAVSIAYELIDKWFGKVKGKDGSGSWQSKIVFSESRIKGSKLLPMTRNNINRFTAGTKDSALYTELSCIGGTTALEYMIMIPEEADAGETQALEGLMMLVVRDICEGFVAIGGQVSVGRGIFKGDYTSPFRDISQEECMKALYQEVIRRADQ